MSENPNVFIAEATRVVTDCDWYLEEAEELVAGIPARHEAVMERIAAAEERSRWASEEWHRLWDAEVGKGELREAEIELHRASWRVCSLRWNELGADDLDPENRKAVARQLAGLVREDAEGRFRDIAARGDDPEVRRTVAGCSDAVATSTHRFLFALCWAVAAVGILVDLPTAVVCERGRADVDATPTIQGGRFEERRLGPCVFYNPESRLPGSD